MPLPLLEQLTHLQAGLLFSDRIQAVLLGLHGLLALHLDLEQLNLLVRIALGLFQLVTLDRVDAAFQFQGEAGAFIAQGFQGHAVLAVFPSAKGNLMHPA
mgnify:CR=1 FL=1